MPRKRMRRQTSDLRCVVLSTSRQLVVPLVTGLFFLTACGGNGDSGPDDRDLSASAEANPSEGSSSEPATETASPAPTEPAVDVEADKAVAEAALLTLQDFPAGWEAAPPDEGDEDDRSSREDIADCVGVDYDQLYDEENVEANSPTFTAENDNEVEHKVSLAADEADMVEVFEIAGSAKFLECAGQSVKDAIADAAEDGVSFGDVTVNQLSVGSFGDETLAYRVTVPVEAEGLSFDLKLETAIVRVGRGQVNITTTSLFSEVPTSELAGYVDVATKRLQETLNAN